MSEGELSTGAAADSRAGHPPPDAALWTAGPPLVEVDLVGELLPRLASWNRKTDAESVRLQRYLDALAGSVGPLPASGLYLAMELDVPAATLLRGRDVENYLKPVVQRLGWGRFVLAQGVKRVGARPRLTVGAALPLSEPAGGDVWGHFACAAGSGHAYPSWKANLRARLEAAGVSEVPAGPVEVQLAWRCSPARNWTDLWKPTADAMGPILGARDLRKPYDPDDDRIVSLALHRRLDPAAGWDVEVAMWWRAAGFGP